MSDNPFFHIDEKHVVRTFGITSAGWGGIWVVMCLPVAIGFFVLLFWNASVHLVLKYWGYIPYPVTSHFSRQAAGALLAACFLFPIPVLIWGLRQDAKIKIRQIREYKEYLNRKIELAHQKLESLKEAQNGQTEAGNAGA